MADRKRTTKAERGGKSRRGKAPHKHDWTKDKETTQTRSGTTYRIVTYKCKNDNCPGPPKKDEEVIARESGARCKGCGTVFPKRHKYNCKYADDD